MTDMKTERTLIKSTRENILVNAVDEAEVLEAEARFALYTLMTPANNTLIS